MPVTPGLRDIILYIQFTTMLGMIAVNWPAFACASSHQWERMIGDTDAALQIQYSLAVLGLIWWEVSSNSINGALR